MNLKYKKVGIPRAFFFHSLPGMFEAFFSSLGIIPVVSAHSDRSTLQLANHVCEAEHCLPNKLFDGHVRSIMDDVDAVLVPRLISLTTGYISCPRFGALPEATRAWVGEKVPIITFDINQTRTPLVKSLEQLARSLGASKKSARKAALEAMEATRKAQDSIRKENNREVTSQCNNIFLVLGHPYTLHDRYISTPILRKLNSLQVGVEVMSFDDSPAQPQRTPADILWCTFAQMHNRLLLLDARYAGVIQITTFNCGCDSMMMERFGRLCRKRGVPYMILMVDEHTGRAGMDTRLEAFVDSVDWKRRRREVGA